MSIHPCEWASQKGCEMKLSCPERVTLWQLARRAATKGFCWPSLVQLAFDTGLHKETLVKVVHALADLGLIRLEKDGQRHVYHILQQVGNPTDRSESGPVTTSRKSDRLNGKSDRLTGRKSDRNRSEKPHEPVGNPTRIYKENIKTNLKGAGADAREPEKRVFDSDLKEDGAPPSVPPEQPSSEPQMAATADSEHFPGLDEAKAFMSRTLGRAVHLAAPEPEVVTDDDRPKTEADRERMAAQIAAMLEGLAGSRKSPTSASTGGKLSMRAYAPGYGPVRDRWEQADACKPPLRDVTLKGEQLAAVRRVALAGLPPT